MFKFGKVSTERLETCHQDLQLIMNTAITLTDVDFGIAEGYRSPERQQELYAQGRTAPGAIVTQIDGVNKFGKHNQKPSMAVDIYAFVDGKASWHGETITYIMGVIRAATSMLIQTKQITHNLRWGGNWDMDGQILTDQGFDDRPHVELVNL